MSDPELDPEIEKALLNGADAGRRLRPEIIRFFSNSITFNKNAFFFRLIAVLLILWSFSVFKSQPPMLSDLESGRFVIDKLLVSLERSIYVNSRRFVSGQKLALGAYSTNVEAWRPLKRIYLEWIEERFSKKKLSEEVSREGFEYKTVELNVDFRKSEDGKKVHLSYNFEDEPGVNFHHLYEIPSPDSLWGPVIGFCLIILTGGWTFSVVVGLLTAVIMESGGNLVAAFELISDLFLLSLGHFYFWALLSLVGISVFFNFERLSSNFGKIDGPGLKWALPSTIVLAPVFPWGLSVLSRFLVTFRIPRSGVGGLILLLSALSASLIFLPVTWGVEWSSVAWVFTERLFSIMALSIVIIVCFFSGFAGQRLKELFTSFPFKDIGIDSGYLNLSKKSLLFFGGRIFVGLLVLDTMHWWTSEVSRLEFLILKVHDITFFTDNLHHFLSSFFLAFVSGSQQQASQWFLLTADGVGSSMEVQTARFASIIDGAFWGGLLSPYGLPCFLLAIGFGLRRVSFLAGVWVLALPLTIWGGLFWAISDLSGVPGIYIGIPAGILFTYLIYIYGKIRFLN